MLRSKKRGQKCPFGVHIVEKKAKKETLEEYYNPSFIQLVFVGHTCSISSTGILGQEVGKHNKQDRQDPTSRNNRRKNWM